MGKFRDFIEADYVSHEELAELMDVKPKSLAEMVSRGTYKFRPLRLGRKVFYRRDEVMQKGEAK